jgi:catechol 2,3-dioxygenase-like lactoylglutathione lyase family enzyme
VLDHVGIRVSDLAQSRRFFEEALFPLGYELVMEHEISGAGSGHAGKPLLWIKQGVPSTAVHVAFSSPNRSAVDDFYDAAIAAGGRDNPSASILGRKHPRDVPPHATSKARESLLNLSARPCRLAASAALGRCWRGWIATAFTH